MVVPTSTADVARLLAAADELRVPVTCRGAGTGLSGASIPTPSGIVLSFEAMDAVLDIDVANHAVVVQPGVTLGQLDAALAPHGLVYPILPGEESASLGGNVATNAGGMRAVKYGVTRHQVLGLEAVLANGDVIRTGGKYVKATTGYDLGQLIIGSEGTLAVVTEVTLKVVPRLAHRATVLAPFATMAEVTHAVPALLGAGLAPLMLEYVDAMAMAATSDALGLDLGMPDEIKDQALAYLLIVLESNDTDRIDADVERAGMLAAEAGALDAYVLPAAAGAAVLDAREEGVLDLEAAWGQRHHRRRGAPGRHPRLHGSDRRDRHPPRSLGRRGRTCRRRQRPPRHLPGRRREASCPDDRHPRHRHGTGRHDLGRARHRAGEARVPAGARGPRQAGPDGPGQGGVRSQRHPQPGQGVHVNPTWQIGDVRITAIVELDLRHPSPGSSRPPPPTW
ncbi:MAG: FAD-binding protein [Acidimicrobiales bacterium]